MTTYIDGIISCYLHTFDSMSTTITRDIDTTIEIDGVVCTQNNHAVKTVFIPVIRIDSNIDVAFQIDSIVFPSMVTPVNDWGEVDGWSPYWTSH